MSSETGTWVPTNQNARPDQDRVKGWLQYSWESKDSLNNLDDLDKACIQRWIRLPGDAWQPVLTNLDAEQLERFMRALTLAEEHLPGCDAGSQSAVIHAFRHYRARFGRPDRAFVRWIKTASKNRFLPYGPAV